MTDSLAADLAEDLDGTFERLVVHYQDRLFGFALRLLGSRADAEEAAQDAFVRAYRALASYPPERIRALTLRPWLYRITLNVARNRLRGRRLATVPLDQAPDGAGRDPVEPTDLGPDTSALRAEQARYLEGLLGRLPARYREAVVFRYVEGFQYAEVAAMLGQPVGTVKANVHRGLRLLRDALERDAASVPAT